VSDNAYLCKGAVDSKIILYELASHSTQADEEGSGINLPFTWSALNFMNMEISSILFFWVSCNRILILEVIRILQLIKLP
jgi:hypothetical protein